VKALLLPLDNRPVTYSFPALLAEVAGIEVRVPPREFFGSLTRAAQIEKIVDWVSHSLSSEKISAILASTDSMLYGGLINGRRSNETLATVLSRTSILKDWHKLARAPIYAQASIMRISDNNDATEEKAYWEQFGKELFRWSGSLHKLLKACELKKPLSISDLQSAEQKIPEEIKTDYLSTRFRNFQANRKLIELVKSGAIKNLIFSQDDSGEYGLNVFEKLKLEKLIASLKLNDRILCYPGADEVLCTLLARYLVQSIIEEKKGIAPTAKLEFFPTHGANCESRYEGQTIKETLLAQINACGITLVSESADFSIIVHTGSNVQGDHIHLPGQLNLSNLDTQKTAEMTLSAIENSVSPVILCDVAYANGADPLLIEKLLSQPNLCEKLIGFAGWNTTGNSAGAALSMGVANWYHGQTTGASSNDALKKSLFIRFADDWAYQALVRKNLNGHVVQEHDLKNKMQTPLERIGKALNYLPKTINLSFPWNRTFEIEVHAK
jgi:hypothetical protein